MRRAKFRKPISCRLKPGILLRESPRLTEQSDNLDFVTTHENKSFSIDIEFFRNKRLRICHVRKRHVFLRGVIEVMKTVVTSSPQPFRTRLRRPDLQ